MLSVSAAGMAEGCSRKAARWGLLMVRTVRARRTAGLVVAGSRHSRLMRPAGLMAGMVPLKLARTPSCCSFRVRPLGLFRLRMVTATVPPGFLVTVHAPSDTRAGLGVAGPAPARTDTASAVHPRPRRLPPRRLRREGGRA